MIERDRDNTYSSQLGDIFYDAIWPGQGYFMPSLLFLFSFWCVFYPFIWRDVLLYILSKILYDVAIYDFLLSKTSVFSHTFMGGLKCSIQASD